MSAERRPRVIIPKDILPSPTRRLDDPANPRTPTEWSGRNPISDLGTDNRAEIGHLHALAILPLLVIASRLTIDDHTSSVQSSDSVQRDPIPSKSFRVDKTPQELKDNKDRRTGQRNPAKDRDRRHKSVIAEIRNLRKGPSGKGAKRDWSST
jgi:hypothetical protein